MTVSKLLFGAILLAMGSCLSGAQTPVLGNIEAPYPNLQAPVHIAGVAYGAGAVPYGAAGTPLILTGSGLGSIGTVQFVAYKNGSPDPAYTVQANVTSWSSNMLFLTVPSGAKSGLVTVTVDGATSNGLPFVVTPGVYSGSCPASPPNNQLQITTASLHDGTAGQAYSATLGASGGTTPYSWSIVSGTLPNGLSLSASGVISGTPTGAAGPVDMTFQVLDSSSSRQSNDAVLSVTIQSQSLTAATVYSYCVPGPSNSNCSSTTSGYDGVGNLKAYRDSVMGNWTYQYDTLERLMSGNATTGSYANQNLCWRYDSFGNRTAQTIQSGACASPETSVPATVSYNSNNQITWVQNSAPNGFTYDQAGNTSADNLNQYLYDGEGRICAVLNQPISGLQTMTGYLYDAEGRRVAKGTISSWGSCDPTNNGFRLTETYVLGPTGEQLTMLDGNNNWQRSNVYGAGKLIATYDLIANPNGTSPSQVAALHFHLTDPLGTRRVQASPVGQPETDYLSLPYGDQLALLTDRYAPSTADDSTPLHFTGKERDAESGNDYFLARYYSSAMGRFLSPDWSAKEEPVPYAKLDDPQTLNLYSYVGNNPLARADADGHCGEDLCIVEGGVTAYFVGAAVLSGAAAVLSTPAGQRSLSTFTSAASANFSSNVSALKSTVSGWFSKKSADKPSTLKPGPHAGEGTPARSGDRDFTPGERGAVNAEGAEKGCHTCGTTDPGTKSGNFIPDHQPPTALNPAGGEQTLYPHCLSCSRTQGGEVNAAKQQLPPPPPPPKPQPQQ